MTKPSSFLSQPPPSPRPVAMPVIQYAQPSQAPLPAIPAVIKREIREQHEQALEAARSQLWLTRTSPTVGPVLTQALPIIFAEHSCVELAERIISAIDSNAEISRLRMMCEELMVKELLGLDHRPGVWCDWVVSILRAYRLPLPMLDAAPTPPIGIESVCRHCGKVFIYHRPRMMSHRPRYCSELCLIEQRAEVASKSRAVDCQWCGRRFETSKGRVKYCTTDCQLKRQRTMSRKKRL